MKRIAVVGLGQIGGSLILAIRQQRLPYHLTGIDTSRKRLTLLQSKLDAASTKWKDAAADLTILCLHFALTLQYLQQASADALLMDVCSGKKKIVDAANRRRLRFVGGHPMAGNERAGEAGWDADLFAGKTFFLCPSKKASAADVEFLHHFLWEMKARPVEVDAAVHDRCVALSSHFPALLSKTYAEISEDVPEIYRGSGYESITRLAKTSPELLQTFMESNSKNLLRPALRLRRQLDQLIKKLKS